MAEASGGAAGNTLPNFKAPREREEPGKNQNDLPTRTAVATRASYRRFQALVELQLLVGVLAPFPGPQRQKISTKTANEWPEVADAEYTGWGVCPAVSKAKRWVPIFSASAREKSQ